MINTLKLISNYESPLKNKSNIYLKIHTTLIKYLIFALGIIVITKRIETIGIGSITVISPSTIFFIILLMVYQLIYNIIFYLMSENRNFKLLMLNSFKISNFKLKLTYILNSYIKTSIYILIIYLINYYIFSYTYEIQLIVNYFIGLFITLLGLFLAKELFTIFLLPAIKIPKIVEFMVISFLYSIITIITIYFIRNNILSNYNLIIVNNKVNIEMLIIPAIAILFYIILLKIVSIKFEKGWW